MADDMRTNIGEPLALEIWGRGKPELLSMFAHQVALSADSVYQSCQAARDLATIDGNPIIAPPIRFYDDCASVIRVAYEILATKEINHTLREFNEAAHPLEEFERTYAD